MNALEIRLSTLGILLSFLSCVTHAQMTAKKIAVGSENLCVTEGAVQNSSGERLTVDAPKMRAYVNAWTSQAIEARFTYLAPTAEETKLGSGEIRRQFGLKLRAQNAVTWCTPCGALSPSRKLWFPSKEIPTRPEAPSAETAATRTSSPSTLAPYLHCDPVKPTRWVPSWMEGNCMCSSIIA